MTKTLTLVPIVLLTAIALTRVAAQEGGSIVRLDPAVDDIVPRSARLEKLRDGYEAPNGPALEGPVWVRSGGYLLFSNMPARTIEKWTPDGQLSTYLNLAGFANSDDPAVYSAAGVTLDAEGRLLYCSEARRAVVRVEKDGGQTIVADRYEGTRLSRPNDLTLKSNGALYFTDNPRQPPRPELPAAVYLLKGGVLRQVATQLTSPNGLVLSPDERSLYVNDISKRMVWRFDVNADDTLAGGRVFVDMSAAQGTGGPDGMKVDVRGNIYDSGPGGLWILAPDGKHLGTITTPDRVSNLAFGDADGKTLYLTMHKGLYRIRLNVEGVRP